MTRKETMTGSQMKIELSKLIDTIVIDLNPSTLDDDIADLLSNSVDRDEAINVLVRMIENYREEL